MDPLIDPRCLVDAEAVAIDGADGVCRAPRLGSGLGLETGFVLLLAAMAVGWFVRDRGALPPRRAALVLTLSLGLVPGAYAVLAVRADRPATVDRAARDVVRLHDAVRTFATDSECAWLRTQGCLACVETARLALVGHACAAEAGAPIDLFTDALTVGCAEVDGALRCGTVDDDAALEGGYPMQYDPFARDGEPSP